MFQPIASVIIMLLNNNCYGGILLPKPLPCFLMLASILDDHASSSFNLDVFQTRLAQFLLGFRSLNSRMGAAEKCLHRSSEAFFLFYAA
jgi:hypothetical protein